MYPHPTLLLLHLRHHCRVHRRMHRPRVHLLLLLLLLLPLRVRTRRCVRTRARLLLLLELELLLLPGLLLLLLLHHHHLLLLLLLLVVVCVRLLLVLVENGGGDGVPMLPRDRGRRVPRERDQVAARPGTEQNANNRRRAALVTNTKRPTRCNAIRWNETREGELLVRHDKRKREREREDMLKQTKLRAVHHFESATKGRAH